MLPPRERVLGPARPCCREGLRGYCEQRLDPFPPLAMRDRALCVSSGVLSIVSIFVASSARAEAPQKPVRLVWIRGERTETCVAPDVLEHRVEARLGRSVFSASAPRAIEGVVQHEGEHWIAHLYVRDERGALEGSRDLANDGPDCAPLEDAVVLAIALAIDPESALRPPDPTVSFTPLPNPPPAPEPSSPPPSQTPPPPPVSPPVPLEPPAFRANSISIPPPNGAVMFRSLLALGLLPRASAGLAMAAEVPLYRILDGTAGVLYFPEVQGQPDFAFGLTAAWLGACASPRLSASVALSLCGKVFLGALHAVVEVLEPIQPGDRLWASGGLSAALRARVVGPLALEVGAELDLPVTREAFVVGGESSAVFQEGVVAGVGFLGLGVTIR